MNSNFRKLKTPFLVNPGVPIGLKAVPMQPIDDLAVIAQIRQTSLFVRFILYVGFFRRHASGKVRWPFTLLPWSLWRHSFLHGPRFGVFRNLPGVIKWETDRLLPRRWGFFILGFEFGDRG